MITVRPWEDLAGMAVFNRIDLFDLTEAELIRGVPYTSLGLFAEWRMAQGAGPLSLIAHDRARPFAVLALGFTGQAGVAQAALLAANHARHRMSLARLAVAVRRRMPSYAAETGFHRIEARSWAGHSSASRLLTAMGFTHEADLRGFGPGGTQTFRQFAWTQPQPANTQPDDTLPPAPDPTQEPEEVS